MTDSVRLADNLMRLVRADLSKADKDLNGKISPSERQGINDAYIRGTAEFLTLDKKGPRADEVAREASNTALLALKDATSNFTQPINKETLRRTPEGMHSLFARAFSVDPNDDSTREVKRALLTKTSKFTEAPLSNALKGVLAEASKELTEKGKGGQEAPVIRLYRDLSLGDQGEAHQILHDIMKTVSPSMTVRITGSQPIRPLILPEELGWDDGLAGILLRQIAGKLRGNWNVLEYTASDEKGLEQPGAFLYSIGRGMALNVGTLKIDFDKLGQIEAPNEDAQGSNMGPVMRLLQDAMQAQEARAQIRPGSNAPLESALSMVNPPSADREVIKKYFALLGEWIEIAIPTQDTLAEINTALQRAEELGERTDLFYMHAIVKSCVPKMEELWDKARSIDPKAKRAALVEELYKVLLNMTGELHIDNVNLPSAQPTPDQAQQAAQTAPLFDLKLVSGLEGKLRKKVIGQDDAIATLVRTIKKAAVGLKRPDRPVGSFLLVGRTGTGKTQLAKSLSQALHPDLPSGGMVRVDCSEYALDHEHAKLIGAPPGYIGHDGGGYLTEAVKKNPRAVVLFDEIEKANPKVHNLLLQIMDEGRLTDSKGETVDFSQVTIIMTSNLGVREAENAGKTMVFNRDAQAQQAAASDAVLESVRGFFRPEFINRLSKIEQFKNLDVEKTAQIAQLKLSEASQLLQENGGKRFIADDPKVAQFIAQKTFSPEYNARGVERGIEQLVEDPITDLIIAQELGEGAVIRVLPPEGDGDALRFVVENKGTPAAPKKGAEAA